MTYVIKRRTEHTSNIWRGSITYQTRQEAQEILSGMDYALKLYIHSVEKF
jgi:hypothetical protein